MLVMFDYQCAGCGDIGELLVDAPAPATIACNCGRCKATTEHHRVLGTRGLARIKAGTWRAGLGQGKRSGVVRAQGD